MTNDQKRIESVIEVLYEYWMSAPELSLGEILYVAQTMIFRKYPKHKTLFYVEDWQMKEAISNLLKYEEETH